MNVPLWLGVACLCGLVFTPTAPAVEYHEFAEQPFDQLSDRQLSEWGERALQINPEKWKHGETAHFVVHFSRRGSSVANHCETFYKRIREFFGNRPDRLPNRKSHVFAFHKPENWEQFVRLIDMEGIGGVTRDHEFFYLASTADGGYDVKGQVQAHEMTHLVFNRLFTGRPPLWLNEGVAEYFGQLETANLPDLRRRIASLPRYPLDELLAASDYPQGALARQSFYAEATVVVDFLTATQERQQKLPAFVEALIAKNDPVAALRAYGYESLPRFQEAYEKYRRPRYR